MMYFTIDGGEFLRIVWPVLEAGKADQLAAVVRNHWRPRQICPLLQHRDVDVRRVAALALGLTGDSKVVAPLSRALRDPDEQVNQMAEHGLWSIWFRSCATDAVGPFREGLVMLSSESYRRAVERFYAAISIDPSFSEAYNQCAIAHFFLSEWQLSLENCCEVVRLTPTHFGALAGIGHCLIEMGDLPEALRYYRRSLQVNPRMSGIIFAVSRLEEGLHAKSDAAGKRGHDQMFGCPG